MRSLRLSQLTPWAVAALVALSFARPAAAQTGVDDDRVSLPQGPGSIEGVGDDVELDPNMGAMSYGVSINLPQGFAGASPSLRLSYSSASGSGPVGIGWSMSVPAIGRMTSRGAPNYDTNDLFDVGGNELVQVGTENGDLIYRSRFEKSFTRYRWVSAGAGAEGYWVAEDPDGSRSYFGANAQGELQDDARRRRGTGGTAEYALVETVDPYGHRLRYGYSTLNGSVPLLTALSWLDDGSGRNDLYSVQVGYESRPDLLSNASRGFEELTADRVSFIRVFNESSIIREYVLTYEASASSGGFSRLARIEHYGQGGRAAGQLYPIAFNFGYSQALGAECAGADCERPYLEDMGELGGGMDFANGRVTLVDINADGLPDLLDTTGSHRIFINTLTPVASGVDHGFSPAVETAVAGTSSFQLGGTGRVQVFDVNGDGRSDLLNAAANSWIRNGGDGDWAEIASFGDVSGLANVDFANAQFIDLDDDKDVDLITSTGQTTQLYRNDGDRFTVSTIASLDVAVGAGSNVQFADMNGDGLNDPVQMLSGGTVRYRLNLGRGQWGANWRTISNLSLTATERARADFEDLNGDGISDIVVVGTTEVRYAINRNGDRFDSFVTVDSSAINGSIPARASNTTVLYSDMNANGSNDIVWITPGSGRVEYVELFPQRPNLLTRVDNGIGSVQIVQYTTAAQAEAEARAAGTPWAHSLQIPMQIVDRIDRFVTLTGNEDGTGLHEIMETNYRDGFYDGVEKQFRGFEQVRTTVAGDAFQEEAVMEYVFDVGRVRPHRNGLSLVQRVLSAGRVLNETNNTYADCTLAEVPSPSDLSALGRRAVYFPCQTASEVVHQEGLIDASAWKTVRTEMTYDGYGNVALNAALGVVGVTGDELYTETEFVVPSSRWLLRLPARERIYNAPGISDFSETLTYYDGEDFVGLPLGTATEGFASRQTKKVDVSGTLLTSMRARRDLHGNSVETMDPLGSVSDTSVHRRNYVYDETGFFLITTDLAVGDYVLRRESRYERDFQKVVEVTKWMLVEGGQVQSNRDSNSYRYDTFGRRIADILPGDSPATPSRVYSYELADPVSSIRIQARSTANGPLDEEVFNCSDGKGRIYQTRTHLGGGQYQVDGFKAYNARGTAVEEWQPWVSSTATCEFQAPSPVLSSRNRLDGSGRVIETTQPGAAIYGEDILLRMVYRPLVTESYDPEDTVSGGEHEATPTITTNDGLGRVIATERTYLEGGSVMRSGERLFYDSTGTFSGYENVEGHRHLITTDLIGRSLQIANPNLGTITYAYDDASNIVSIEDGRGVLQQREYDGQNRIVVRFDAEDRDGTLTTWTYDRRPETCPATECTNLPGQLVASTFPLRLVDGTAVTGTDRFGYDVRRRQVSASRVFGDLATLRSQRAFDNQDRLVSTTSPDGTVVTRTHDVAGRINAIPGYVRSIGYEDRGLRATMVLENQATVTRGFDALLRVASVQHTDASGRMFHDLTVSRDRNQTVLGVVDAGAGAVDLTATYGIDNWYRVTDATYADGSEAFTFDRLDRVLTKDGASLTYGAQPLAATAMASLAMGYDGGGYLTRRNGMTLGRDDLGRITSISHDGEVTGVHGFNAGDRVLQMTAEGTLVLYGFDRYEVRDGVGTTFVSVGKDRVARHERTDLGLAMYPDGNANGQIDAGDAHLSSVRKTHLLAAAATRVLMQEEDEVTYLHADQIGSLVAATDSSGTVRGERSFMLHGLLRASEGYVGAYGFTGQEQDATTGLLHMRFRDLDPETGRWDCFDPSFVRLGVDATAKHGEAATGYAYVANNASTLHDPSGLNGKGRKRSGSAQINRFTPTTGRVKFSPRAQKNLFKQHAKYYAANEKRWGGNKKVNGDYGGHIKLTLNVFGNIAVRPNYLGFQIPKGGIRKFFQAVADPRMAGERSTFAVHLNNEYRTYSERKAFVELVNSYSSSGGGSSSNESSTTASDFTPFGGMPGQGNEFSEGTRTVDDNGLRLP